MKIIAGAGVSKEMNIFSALILFSVVVIVAVLGAWVYKFYGQRISSNPSDWGVFGDYVGGILSTVLSGLGFIGVLITVIMQGRAIKAQNSSINVQFSAMEQEREIKDDEVYGRQAVLCFESAFSSITESQDCRKLYRNRSAWLDASRLLLTADDLISRIKSDSAKIVYDSERKIWRSKFSNLLDPRNCKETIQPSYYDGVDWGDYFEEKSYEKLDSSSIYVIYSFASWQDGEFDLLASVKKSWDIEKVSKKYMGARLYLDKHF